jgi:hypothetical protein
MEIQRAVRPIGLVVVASLLCIAPIYLSVLSIDEFASKFILSDKVMKLHRLIMFLSAGQWLLTLVLIYKVESKPPSALPKISN